MDLSVSSFCWCVSWHPRLQMRPREGLLYETAGAGRMKRLLFVCVENSCRSQIAEAFARIHGGDED